jgi:hypothetical protein
VELGAASDVRCDRGDESGRTRSVHLLPPLRSSRLPNGAPTTDASQAKARSDRKRLSAWWQRK